MLFFSFELYAQKVDLITKKEAIKDVKYLKKYLMNSYVIYDENSQLNDKLEEIDTRIINELELLEKDEIYVQDFQQLIVKDLKKNVSIPDSHLVVFSTENFFKIFPHNDIYFPGITLEKQNENFIVFENYSDEIKKGDVYTGKKDNIFPTLCTDGSLKFQYGVKSSKPIKLCSFPHDNTNSNVLLKSKKTEANLSLDNRNENIKILDDKIYLSNLDFTNSKKYVEKFPIDSKEIPNYSLILDLRNNSGGNTNGVLDFIHLFLFANDESVNKEQLKNYFSEGEKVLISADIWDANLDLSRSLGVPRSTLLKMSLIKWLYKIFKIKHVSIEGNITTQDYLFSEEFFPKKIIILMNRNTASAAELLIADLQELASDKVIMFGENTAGCINFVGNYKYILPKSKIGIALSNIDEREVRQLKNSKFYGETNGFYPDYWGIPDDIFLALNGEMNAK